MLMEFQDPEDRIPIANYDLKKSLQMCKVSHFNLALIWYAKIKI